MNASTNVSSHCDRHYSQCCIVIPYKDNSQVLAKCLRSVLAHIPPHTSVVVVDDGSQVVGKVDPDLVDFWSDRRLHLLQHSQNRGAGAARNTAIQWCWDQDIEIIILLDSDCLIQSGFVESHYRLHQQYPEVAVFGGAIRGTGEGLWAEIDNLMSWFTSIPNSPMREVQGIYHIPTTNMSLKLKMLNQVSPLFDQRLRTGEDVQMVKRLRSNGYRLMFAPQPEIIHCDRQSFIGFLQHQYRWGLHTFVVRFPNYQDYKLTRFFLIPPFFLLLPLFAIATSFIILRPWLRQSWQYLGYFPIIFGVCLWKGVAVIIGTCNFKLATY